MRKVEKRVERRNGENIKIRKKYNRYLHFGTKGGHGCGDEWFEVITAEVKGIAYTFEVFNSDLDGNDKQMMKEMMGSRLRSNLASLIKTLGNASGM